jgi:hypothetical protein
MDTRPNGELNEKNFIREDKARPPNSYWLIILIGFGVAALLGIGVTRMAQDVKSVAIDKPFLQVTNREFSLFLWQNIEYMKDNAKEKTGYLPGFQSMQRVTPKAQTADEYVAAPPEILFRYHTWKRLVGDDYITRPIPVSEFVEFLSYDEEWLPKYWSKAPKEYQNIINILDKLPKEDLTQLPTQVKMAFIGWKNFYKEGDSINQLTPNYGDIKTFIAAHPGYDRSHWRNLFPNYLKSLGTADTKGQVPESEIPLFLRVALFNFKQSK